MLLDWDKGGESAQKQELPRPHPSLGLCGSSPGIQGSLVLTVVLVDQSVADLVGCDLAIGLSRLSPAQLGHRRRDDIESQPSWLAGYWEGTGRALLESRRGGGAELWKGGKREGEGWAHRQPGSRLTFLVGAAGHQGAVGPLTLGPVGAHLHFVVAIGIQVGELHGGHLAVQEVGFRLGVALDPVLHLWAGDQ